MSKKHPIIAVTGSSGAGTSTVMQSFQHIFRREGIRAQVVEGDSFHRFDRMQMRARMKEAEASGNKHYSHFGPYSNLLQELEALFRNYGENGAGRVRKYVHDAGEAVEHGVDPGCFTDWKDIEAGSDLMFYEGLHGAYVDGKIDVARHVDLLVGVVPIINLEWIQKLHQRIGLVFGSKNEVDRIERYHREYDEGTDQPYVSPLFNERSLYRPEART